MKANELRIGNFVLRQEFLPRTLDNVRFDEIIVNHNDINACFVDSTSFKPIPLTEEWLLNFGFKKYQSTGVVGFDNLLKDELTTWYEIGKFTIVQWGVGTSLIFSNHNLRIKLEYVHQLQNLYFALTGEELTYGGDND